MEPISKEFVFQRGHVFNKNRICFVTNHAKSTTQDIPNAQCYILRDGKDWGFTAVKWRAVALSSTPQPSPALIVLGREGEIVVGDAQGYHEEQINDSGSSPKSRGPMRNMRAVANSIFAVGMARQVYQRSGEGTWIRYESGLPSEAPLNYVAGFNSIDGPTIDDLYAVGWGGEVWHYNGKLWHKEESPTNLPLFDVLAVSHSAIYLCGHAGTILRGHAGRWTTIDFEGPKVSFRSMAWFDERLFLADGHGLYFLSNGRLLEVDFGVGATVPSSHLHANDGILLSVAGKEVFTTGNGTTWIPLPI